MRNGAARRFLNRNWAIEIVSAVAPTKAIGQLCRRGDVAIGRLAREDWVAVARKALIAGGVEEVKVDGLARRLKVTRGSFYHHFESRQDLLNALIEDWKANNLQEIEDLRSTGADMKQLFRVWVGEDPNFPSFDIAVRVWARKSSNVSKLVRGVDDTWVALLQSMLEASGIGAPESFVRARIMYFHQVGYYALSIEESLAERATLAPIYYAALTGSAAPEGMSEWLIQPGKSKNSKASRSGVTSGKRGKADRATARRHVAAS